MTCGNYSAFLSPSSSLTSLSFPSFSSLFLSFPSCFFIFFRLLLWSFLDELVSRSVLLSVAEPLNDCVFVLLLFEGPHCSPLFSLSIFTSCRRSLDFFPFPSSALWSHFACLHLLFFFLFLTLEVTLCLFPSQIPPPAGAPRVFTSWH